MKKLIVLFLVLAMLLSGCSSSSAKEEASTTPAEVTPVATEEPTEESTEAPVEEPTEAPTEAPVFSPIELEPAKLPTGYTLKEIGTIAEDYLGFRSDGVIIHRETDEEADENIDYLRDRLGNFIGDKPLHNVTNIVDNIMAVRLVSDDINSTGLVSADGEVLIPFEAAIISTMRTDIDDPDVKYLKVVYSTGQTENEEEAFFYVTDKFFSLSPDDDDVFFKGFAKIYDLENRRFLSFVITNPSVSAAQACGDYLALREDDVLNLYDDQENLISQSGSYPELAWNYLIKTNHPYYEVYGCDETLYFRSENTLSAFTENLILETYYNEDDVRQYAVRDIYGNLLFESGSKRIELERYGLFKLYDEEEEVLVDQTGAELLRIPSFFTHMGYGYWQYHEDTDDGYKYFMVDPNATATEVYSAEKLCFVQQLDPGYSFYVFADGDFTLSLNASGYSQLTKGLVSVKIDGLYGVYDLFSGEELLPPIYKRIDFCYDCIYAYKNDAWTVFETTLNN